MLLLIGPHWDLDLLCEPDCLLNPDLLELDLRLDLDLTRESAFRLEPERLLVLNAQLRASSYSCCRCWLFFSCMTHLSLDLLECR